MSLTDNCKEGMPPLMYALRGSSTECAKLLLAIPDLKLSAVSEKGVTLVHAAGKLYYFSKPLMIVQ